MIGNTDFMVHRASEVVHKANEVKWSTKLVMQSTDFMVHKANEVLLIILFLPKKKTTGMNADERR